MLRFSCLVVVVLQGVFAAENKIPIGLILSPEYENYQKLFETQFRDVEQSNDFSFELIVEHVDWPDSFHVVQAINQLLEKNVVIILTPSTVQAYSNIISYSNNFQVPFLNLGNVLYDTKEVAMFGLHMKPNELPAVVDIMQFNQWKYYNLIYDGSGEQTANELSMEIVKQFNGPTSFPKRIRNADDAMHALEELHPGARNVIFCLRPQLLRDVFTKFAQSEHLERSSYEFIVADVTDGDFLKKYASGSSPLNLTIMNYPQGKKTSSKSDSAILMIVKDTVTLLNKLFQAISSNPNEMKSILNSKYFVNRSPSSVFTQGPVLNHHLRKIKSDNFQTGEIYFDTNGLRRNYSFEVTQLKPDSSMLHLTWTDRNGLKIPEPIVHFQSDSPLFARNDSYFVVTSLLNEPFLMIKDASKKGNARYQGFIVDMLEAMAKKFNFSYEIQLVADGMYGRSDINGEWTGMIGELISGEADVALADITINVQRSEVVNLYPFMNVGIGMLMKKPSTIPKLPKPDPASIGYLFLHTFSKESWICILVAYIAVSVILSLVSKFTKHPHLKERYKTPSNASLFQNSFWYSFGSLFFSGSGIYPRSIGSRWIAAIFSMFAFFLAVLYIATMASNMAPKAKLPILGTNCPVDSEIMSVIKDSIHTGKPKIGAVRGGTTAAYFRESRNPTNRQMYDKMLQWNMLLPSNADGIQRVQEGDGDVAFFMESASLHYATNHHCDLYRARNLLDHKSYGIATRKSAPYNWKLSTAILQLQEYGEMKELIDKWWKNTCPEKDAEPMDIVMIDIVENTFLSAYDLRGLFYFLIVGVILGVIASVIETVCVKKRHNKRHHNDAPKREITTATEVEVDIITVKEVDVMHRML